MSSGTFRPSSRAVRSASAAAAEGYLMLFGIKPDRAATGYGYIRPSAEPDRASCFKVEAFVEKPDAETAKAYVARAISGTPATSSSIRRCCWRSTASSTPRPSKRRKAPSSVPTQDLGRIVLAADAFGACAALSIDFAVLEQSDRVGVVPVTMDWSDIGGWNAIWELKDKDRDGNAGPEGAVFLDARNNLVLADNLVCLVGDRQSGGGLVRRRPSRVRPEQGATTVKDLVARLKAEGRKEVAEHLRVFRPWGSYQSIDIGTASRSSASWSSPADGFRCRSTSTAPSTGSWCAARRASPSATARRSCAENESTYIPLGEVHRLENPGKIPLEIIEVQSGSYLGEDDIVRLEDVYNRS